MMTISPAERRAGYAILMALALVLTGVLVAQHYFNPALAPVVGLESTTSSPAWTVPAGLEALGPVEVFGPDELSDKIDGRAELYIGAGFTRLLTRRMAVPGHADRWLELFVYTMNSPDAAYAVFSGQRRAGARPAAVGDEGYLTDNAGFALRSNIYAEAVAAASGLDEVLVAALRGVLGEATAGFVEGPPEKSVLPEEDQQPGTLTLLTEDAFGFADFDQVYAASYTNAEGSGVLFVSRRDQESTASSLTAAYRSFLEENGAESRTEVTYELFGRFEAVASEGAWLLGVHEGTTVAWTESALAGLRARIRTHGGGEHDHP